MKKKVVIRVYIRMKGPEISIFLEYCEGLET